MSLAAAYLPAGRGVVVVDMHSPALWRRRT